MQNTICYYPIVARLFLFILLCLTCQMFYGCTDHVKQAQELVDANKYGEALDFIKKLDSDEMAKPELRKLHLKAIIGYASGLINQKHFRSAKTFLAGIPSEFLDNPEILDIENQISEMAQRLIDGEWYGTNDANSHMPIKMTITAINSSTFQGHIFTQGSSPFNFILDDGFFDGHELSAHVFVSRWVPFRGPTKGSIEYSLKGTINNDTMKLTISYFFRNASIQWTLKKAN